MEPRPPLIDKTSSGHTIVNYARSSSLALAFDNAFAPPKGLNIVAVIVEDDLKQKEGEEIKARIGFSPMRA